ncbi:hypothetical protein BSL78_10246, partial [Apostichopus japonicus]
ADVCNDAICITHRPYSERPCLASSKTRTVCYSLYSNESTNRVQTRICWDQSQCMDLVNFCKGQRSVLCTSYSSVTTLAPVWTLIPQEVTGPTGATRTTPLTSNSKNSSVLSTITSSYPGTPTAEANKRRVFISGAVSGICAAAIPMIIAVLIFLLLKRRHNNQFQVSDASKRNESLEMMDGPVYASIGPELPMRQGNLVRGDISSSARSLHCSAPRRTNLLGNLQRNKSLPALAYEISSLPMERNDILRTISMANRLSGLSEPPSSPLSSNRLSDQYTPDKASKNNPESPCALPQTSGKQRHGDTTRHIPSKNGTTALTNIIYDEAILSAGPMSKYSESDEGPNQDAKPNRLRKASGQGECRPYTTLEKDPHITPSPEGKHGGHAQYADLELDKSLDASTTASYTVLVTAGDAMSMETGQRASLDNNSQKHVTVIDGTRHGPQYMELDKGGAGDPPINEYMGIAANAHQPTSAYMGLETNTARETNHYLGIGDGPSGSSEGLDLMGKKNIPINVASGAYAELSLLNRGDETHDAYMGLNSPDLHVARKASEASIGSYVGLEKNLNSGPPVKKQHDQTNKRKFWKSKSTFHKRKETSNGLGTTYEGLQTKSKRSFLFRNKKSKKPPPACKENESDMCLDLNLSSPPPTDVNPAPQYFTLELDPSSHSRGKQQGSSFVSSVPEYQEPISEDDEPFRLRSQSQPTRHGYSTGLSEDYETITDDWGPANFQRQPHK